MNEQHIKSLFNWREIITLNYGKPVQWDIYRLLWLNTKPLRLTDQSEIVKIFFKKVYGWHLAWKYDCSLALDNVFRYNVSLRSIEKFKMHITAPASGMPFT